MDGYPVLFEPLKILIEILGIKKDEDPLPGLATNELLIARFWRGEIEADIGCRASQSNNAFTLRDFGIFDQLQPKAVGVKRDR